MKIHSVHSAKRSWVLLFALLFALACGAVPASAAESRPNIVFVLVDDLRWDALGCMGHPFVKTPNVDRIAKEGALFQNFFVSIPLCSPSRGSFLTGTYPHTHGVIDNTDHSELSHKLVTFPMLLHDAGYETAYVGKWHMGNDDSPRPGFDHWVSFKGQGQYDNPMINVDGKASKVDGYMTDILNEHALEFVKGEHKKPFVLYLAHKAVHGPFTPADRHKDLYADDPIKPAASLNDPLTDKPALTREVEPPPAAKKKNKKKAESSEGENAGSSRERRVPERAIRSQLRALAAVDEGVGQLLKALEESKQLDNTVFVFSSDNGFFWGEHGLADKRWAYEESIRDPLLIRYPKLIKAGTKLDQMVLNIDIAPTFLELGGVPVPKNIQGQSLLPLFKDPNASWRHSLLTEYFMEKQYPRTPTWQAVRTERWKYIHYTELKDMDELYDLKADPYEMKNVIREASARPGLSEMTSELEQLKKATRLRPK
jgi:N-acetylglucosamine-6-sulfatase